MLEYDKVYNCGRRSLLFFVVRYGWAFFLIGGGLLYLDFEIYFGSLNQQTADLLATKPDWYITVPMLSQWIFLLAISIMFVGYIRSKVLHRKIKFKIDKHAFHLREGLFMIKESTIPYLQISNVHLVRPYAYRLLGLARLDIMTVSDKDVLRRNSGKLNDYLIPLIDTSIAKALAHHLMKHASSGIKHTEDEYTDLESEDDLPDSTQEEKNTGNFSDTLDDEDNLEDDTR